MLMESVVLGLAVGWVRRGRLANLAQLPWRWPALFVLALLLQRLPFRLAARWPVLSSHLAAIYLATYLVLVFAVLVNYRLPAFRLFGLGVLLNFLVIAANGGHMPVSANAVARAGLPPLPPAAVAVSGQPSASQGADLAGDAPSAAAARVPASPHISMGARTRLNFLGDLFFIPPPYPNPRIFSLGDLLMAIGIFWLIQSGMVGRGVSSPSRRTPVALSR